MRVFKTYSFYLLDAIFIILRIKQYRCKSNKRVTMDKHSRVSKPLFMRARYKDTAPLAIATLNQNIKTPFRSRRYKEARGTRETIVISNNARRYSSRV